MKKAIIMIIGIAAISMSCETPTFEDNFYKQVSAEIGGEVIDFYGEKAIKWSNKNVNTGEWTEHFTIVVDSEVEAIAHSDYIGRKIGVKFGNPSVFNRDKIIRFSTNNSDGDSYRVFFDKVPNGTNPKMSVTYFKEK